MKRVLICASCVLASVTALHAASLVRPVRPDKLQLAVEHLMLRLYQDEKGLFVGMDAADAAKELDGAADVAGQLYAPLEETKLAPKGQWEGVVSVFLTEEDAVLDTMDVVLLTGKYDEGKMGQFLSASARENGFTLEQDYDDPRLYSTAEEGRVVWIALGEDIIALTVDLGT